MRTNSSDRFAPKSNANLKSALQRAADSVVMESLEGRDLRSVSLSGGVLFVTGTAGADRLEIDQAAPTCTCSRTAF